MTGGVTIFGESQYPTTPGFIPFPLHQISSEFTEVINGIIFLTIALLL